MSRMTIEDLYIAVEWLNVNEGDGGESCSCRRVVAFLMKEINKRNFEKDVADAIKESGLPEKYVRKKMKKVKNT